MSAWGKRTRVRLHSGGISPGQVRLRQRGASEKATAPGRDIRDLGPDKGPKMCRNCGKPVARPRAVHCDRCLADTKLVREVRAELKRLRLPPLGKTVSKGGPMWKKRRRAEAALQRLGRVSDATTSKSATAKDRRPAVSSTSPGPATCVRCFVALPATGHCDTCA